MLLSTNRGALARLSMFEKRGRELILDLVVGTGWLVYATGYLVRVLNSRKLIDLQLLLFLTLLAVLFLMRSPARRSGALWESLLAFAGILLTVIVLRPAPGSLRWLGEPIQIIALAGMLAAAISLGRSFGIAPADRGLRTTGLYRWVRHPLYATELSFFIGYLLANPAWRNLIGLIVILPIQIVRIMREERILEGYAAYAEQVRYRLIPFVW